MKRKALPVKFTILVDTREKQPLFEYGDALEKHRPICAYEVAGYIYTITNIVNGKCYIGSAVSYKDRFKLHISQLNRRSHHSIKLQRAWNKYCEDSFVFEILECCYTLGGVDTSFRKDLLLDREQYYLDTLLFANCDDDRFDHLGYNILRIAGSNLGAKLNLGKEAIELRQEQGRVVGKVNTKLNTATVISILDDLFFHGYSIKNVADKYRVSKSTIGDIKNNRTWKEVDRTGYQDGCYKRAKLSDETRKRMSIAKSGEGSRLSRLTVDNVQEIKRQLHQGGCYRTIAKHFNVHKDTIWKILRGYTWKNVKYPR